MIIAAYEKGAEHFCYLYYSWEALHIDTFSPECKMVALIELGRIKGNTYAERKEYVRELAEEYSNSRNELYPLSYLEGVYIDDWFERQGKRYGLLREFHENGIC